MILYNLSDIYLCLYTRLERTREPEIEEGDMYFELRAASRCVVSCDQVAAAGKRAAQWWGLTLEKGSGCGYSVCFAV